MIFRGMVKVRSGHLQVQVLAAHICLQDVGSPGSGAYSRRRAKINTP